MKWDGLKPLPGHILAPLLRALACIPRTADTRLLLVKRTPLNGPFIAASEPALFNVPAREQEREMRTGIAIAMALAIMLPTLAEAGYSCQTRKSGSVTITSCSGSKGGSSTCRSYMSGSVRKTSCRS